jgi:hypothetical protein
MAIGLEKKGTLPNTQKGFGEQWTFRIVAHRLVENVFNVSGPGRLLSGFLKKCGRTFLNSARKEFPGRLFLSEFHICNAY